MSSAVQTIASAETSSLEAHHHVTYPLEMFQAVAPYLGSLLERLHQGTTQTNTFKVNDQLFGIYESLGHTRQSIEERIPRSMLSEGRNHIFFSSTQQHEQGDWIKEVFQVVTALEERIREYFREPTDPIELRNEVVTAKSSESISLPRFLEIVGRFDITTGQIAIAR